MSDLVQLNIPSLEHFSEGAKKEFKTQAEKLIQDLVNETYRVETARREANADQEVIQVDVIDAVRQSRRFNPVVKKGWYKACQIAVPILSLIPGFIFDKESLTLVILAFIIILVVGLLTLVLVLKND